MRALAAGADRESINAARETEMGMFEGKVALVTGGGSGIGRATALAFAREGAKVVIGNRNVEQGAATVAAIRAAGGEASFKRTDVQIEADARSLVEHAFETFGRLDVANNNAGIIGDIAPLTEQTESNFQAVLGTNAKGVWLCMKHEIPRMIERGGGAIVNTASMAGVIGSSLGLSFYIASKHAVLGLTKCAALENARKGVRVNAVAPAVIETPMPDQIADALGMDRDFGPMHPLGRSGKPEEVAEAILWLCSDKSSFVTGHTLLIDGGYTVQ